MPYNDHVITSVFKRECEFLYVPLQCQCMCYDSIWVQLGGHSLLFLSIPPIIQRLGRKIWKELQINTTTLFIPDKALYGQTFFFFCCRHTLDQSNNQFSYQKQANKKFVLARNLIGVVYMDLFRPITSQKQAKESETIFSF